MAQPGRVLVIGATRGTGMHVVRRLLRDGYAVRVLARTPAKAAALFGGRVEVVQGDLTRPETLEPAIRGAGHVVLTAGVTKRPAPERLVKATEYDGTINVIRAARAAGLRGRLVYMGAIGTVRRSVLSFLLDLIKGNTLRWRRRAEEEIRRSGLDYTILHAGILSDGPAGRRAIRITPDPLPMRPWYRVGREDVAEVIVQSLREGRARNATFDVVWGHGPPPGRQAVFPDRVSQD